MTGSQDNDTMILMPKIAVDTGEFYSATEAANLLKIGYATIYRWIKSSKLIPIKLAGRTLIPKSEVERIQKEGATAAPVIAPSGSRGQSGSHNKRR